MRRRAFLAALAASLAAAAARGEDCSGRRGRLPEDPAAIRAVVVLEGDDDPEVAWAIRQSGANTLVTQRPPDAASAAAAARAGLRYVARIPVRDVLRLPGDPRLLEQIRGIPNLYGLEYLDEGVTEGYASPETQRLAYGILKALLPGVRVLYATRLDPIATDPTYLDLYFRPEFSDLVTPYFYPVGTTVLGAEGADGPWEERLRSLLGPLAARTPVDRLVLPVLQGFEQPGYPVGRDFPLRQLEVYREFWPDVSDLAVFWWGGGPAGLFQGLTDRPALLAGFEGLFGAAPLRPLPCLAPPRPSVPARAGVSER
jgi:hypothetical protein